MEGAYVVGSDGVPLCAEIECRDTELVCAKRADGPASVALLWPVAGCGSALLESSRLLDRDRPYNLDLEIVRGRLMRMSHKREEWGLFDYEDAAPVGVEMDRARDLFVEALKADSHPEQSELAGQALAVGFNAGEALTRFHAELFLERRKQARAFTRRTFGCTIDPSNTSEAYRERLVEAFDFVHLPIPWRMLEPEPGQLNFQPFDGWIEWLGRRRMPIKMGPLVSLDPEHIPDWLAKKRIDYEDLRNLVFEHVRRIAERYESYVFHWDVVSGVHAANPFDFTMDRLMELTRVTASLVKQLCPRAQTLIDLVAPWGEYYARNQKTIPPGLYADMVTQSGVGFDGLGVQMRFGAPTDGLFVRDMFQISDKLDRLGNFGKSLHVTAVQVPSAPVGEGPSAGGGVWRDPWDEEVQARWLHEFLKVALSKPFVDSVTWRDLADRPEACPLAAAGGLLNQNLTTKPAFEVVKAMRAGLQTTSRRPPVQLPA